jgi:uncharacterized protein
MAITSDIKLKIAHVAEKYNLSLVLLFGSQATGKSHKGSDYDIAYLGDAPLSLDDESKLIVDLMQVFGIEKVDLTSIRGSSPLLLHEIVSTGSVLFEKTPSLFTALYIYALRTYEEARPLFELRSAFLKKRIAHS